MSRIWLSITAIIKGSAKVQSFPPLSLLLLALHPFCIHDLIEGVCFSSLTGGSCAQLCHLIISQFPMSPPPILAEGPTYASLRNPILNFLLITPKREVMPSGLSNQSKHFSVVLPIISLLLSGIFFFLLCLLWLSPVVPFISRKADLLE